MLGTIGGGEVAKKRCKSASAGGCPNITLLKLADGTKTCVEDMERFDIGKLHLDGQDFAGALRWLDGLDLLPARNNRALALFHLSRIDDALAS